MAFTARRTSQLLFLVAFFVVLTLNRFPYTGRVPGDFFLRASPLLPVAGLIEAHRVCLEYWPALAILVVTVVLGRVFCGWACPLGTTIDAARSLLKRSPESEIPCGPRLSRLPLIILLFVTVCAFFGIGVWSFLDPLALYNRVATVVLFPVLSRAVTAFFAWLALWPLVGGLFAPVASGLKAGLIPEGDNLFLAVWPLAFLLSGILLLELIAPRFWCRFICPAGAWLGLLARFAPYRRKVDSTCVRCGGCRRTCRMGAIAKDEFERTRQDLCIVCLTCLESCPPRIECTNWSATGGVVVRADGLSRRQFVGTVFGSLAAVGTFRVGLTNRATSGRIIRPPGAILEPLFLDRCIRCLACVRMCRSNGGCLQPGSIHQDLLELWTPEALMRVGYCEYGCNLCGQVCPTGVIRPLSLEEKQKTSMGMAHFDRNLCIPYARGENCMVCEEHCPVKEKAIRFENREVTLPDGRQRKVKVPYVVRELCIGCGICECKCPLPGEPAIFVVNEGAVRPKPPES